MYLDLQDTDAARFKKAPKMLYFMEMNLRHPGLQTHKFEGRVGPKGEEIFETYVENRMP